MKSIFIGSVEFSEQALKKMIDLGVDIKGVITKEASSFNSDFVDLSKLALKFNIPYLFTKDINSLEVSDWIRKKEPDVLFCFGWSQLLKKEILDIANIGVVGYHPAKIPENRGRHPLIWALALGLKETASTFFIMDEGADSGDIISQKSFKIDYEDYAEDVYKKMTRTALDQIEEFLPNLISNEIERVSQDLSSGNKWRKRGKEDGKIDFRMSSSNIYNLVRALSKPYVGAHLVHEGSDIKVWRTNPVDFQNKNIEPGKILDIKKENILVKTGDAAIWLLDHEFSKIPQVNSYL